MGWTTGKQACQLPVSCASSSCVLLTVQTHNLAAVIPHQVLSFASLPGISMRWPNTIDTGNFLFPQGPGPQCTGVGQAREVGRKQLVDSHTRHCANRTIYLSIKHRLKETTGDTSANSAHPQEGAAGCKSTNRTSL